MTGGSFRCIRSLIKNKRDGVLGASSVGSRAGKVREEMGNEERFRSSEPGDGRGTRDDKEDGVVDRNAGIAIRLYFTELGSRLSCVGGYWKGVYRVSE
jgi:hypothetical protein